MRHKNRKYIVYVNVEYMRMLFESARAYSHDEQTDIRRRIMKDISDFIRGEGTSVLHIDQFRDESGRMVRAFDIVPLPTCNMRHIKRQSANKRIQVSQLKRIC